MICFHEPNASLMTESTILRPAKQSDARAITELYIASRKAFVPFAPLRHSDDSVYQWIDEVIIPKGHMTVVEKDGIIVGMMVLSKEQNVGWIDQLYLAPSAVGEGLGSLLVDKAKHTLGSPIRLCTFQQNIDAQRFYERHGFQMIELRDGSANEEQCPDAIYEWL
jgi:ribosomal protein S18 acetylase RimI-like enzyme